MTRAIAHPALLMFGLCDVENAPAPLRHTARKLPTRTEVQSGLFSDLILSLWSFAFVSKLASVASLSLMSFSLPSAEPLGFLSEPKILSFAGAGALSSLFS